MSSSKRVTLPEAIHLSLQRCHYLAMNAAYTARPTFGAPCSEDLAKLGEAPINGTGRASSFSLGNVFIKDGRRAQMQCLKRARLLAVTHAVST
jgi:hypothetical protein